MQQHQLRLYFHTESPRHFKQPQKYIAKINFLQRLVENRLAYRTDGAFKFIDARFFWHPAGLDMRDRHGFVIALEKSGKVARKIILVRVSQCAHDAEIDARINTVATDKDIPWVHIGVKKTIAKHLRKKYLHAITRQSCDVDIGGLELCQIIDRDGVDPFHHHHILVAVIEVHLGHVQ